VQQPCSKDAEAETGAAHPSSSSVLQHPKSFRTELSTLPLALQICWYSPIPIVDDMSVTTRKRLVSMPEAFFTNANLGKKEWFYKGINEEVWRKV
jgi:hypothetical protein